VDRDLGRGRQGHRYDKRPSPVEQHRVRRHTSTSAALRDLPVPQTNEPRASALADVDPGGRTVSFLGSQADAPVRTIRSLAISALSSREAENRLLDAVSSS
jgi:hypothetical protein